MPFKTPPKTICPHCGFESDIEELCPACGKLADSVIPARKISLVQAFGTFLTRMHEKGFHGNDIDDVLKEEPEFDSSWSLLSSNVYHSRFQMFHGIDDDNDNE